MPNYNHLPENCTSGQSGPTFQSKVSNLLANNSEGWQNGTRDIYKAGASLYSVDSEDWSQSQYSENGRYSPDPFDTERIFVDPPAPPPLTENGSRYYSFVPHSPSYNVTEESQLSSPSQIQNGTTSLDYGGSPASPPVCGNTSRPAENVGSPPSTNGSVRSTNNMESPIRRQEMAAKPPLELLKKRDEAFSWLDDAIGGLSIGPKPMTPNTLNTSSCLTTGGNTSSSSNYRLTSANHSLIYSSTTSIPNSATLNSGDETWAELNDSRIFSGSSAANSSNIQHPYLLPPPPTITRNNLSPGISNSMPRQGSTILPAYRSPPPPQNSVMNSFSSLPNKNNTKTGNIDYNGLMQAVGILSNNVPSASRDDIMTALRQCNGSISVAERLLKIEELFKLGIADKSKCEMVLTRTNWNIENAASVLLEYPNFG